MPGLGSRLSGWGTPLSPADVIRGLGAKGDWWDARRADTLVDSSGNPVADGQTIYEWIGRVNGLRLQQATSSNRPTRSSSFGMPAALFDGADDRMALTAYPADTTNILMGIAYESMALAAGQVPVGWGDVGTQAAVLSAGLINTSAGVVNARHVNTSAPQAGGRAFTTGVVSQAVARFRAGTSPSVYQSVGNGANTTPVTTSPGDVTSYNATFITLGARQNGSTPVNMKVLGMFAIAGDWTEYQARQLTQFMIEYYGARS